MASGPVVGASASLGTGPGTKGEPVKFIFSRCQVSTCMATPLILFGESTSCANGGAYTCRDLPVVDVVVARWRRVRRAVGASVCWCNGCDMLRPFVCECSARMGEMKHGGMKQKVLTVFAAVAVIKHGTCRHAVH